MNASFTNLNEIIHPNAESIPEYIRHYASAMFVNSSSWEDRIKVFEEIEMEGHEDDYIHLCMSYLDMLQSTCKLVTEGKTYFSTQIDQFITLMISSLTTAIFTF